MPLGKPSILASATPPQLYSTMAGLNPVTGGSIQASTISCGYIQQINKWLLSAANSSAPVDYGFLADSPIGNNWTVLPNLPVAGTRIVYYGTTPLSAVDQYHIFNLIGGVADFYRASLDFSSWAPFNNVMAGSFTLYPTFGLFLFFPGTVLGDLVIQLRTTVSSYDIYYSADGGANWLAYSVPSSITSWTNPTTVALSRDEQYFYIKTSTAILRFGKPGFTPGLVFPIDASPVGSARPTAFYDAGDGRVIIGNSNGVVSHSVDNGQTFSETLLRLGSSNSTEITTIVELDGEIYISTRTGGATFKTRDFSSFELVPQTTLENTSNASTAQMSPRGGYANGLYIDYPTTQGFQPVRYWTR